MRLDDERVCLVCDFCGRLEFTGPDADGVQLVQEPAGLSCPVCTEPMLHASVASQRLIHCPRCRGLLVAMPVFADLVRDLKARRPVYEGAPSAPRTGPDTHRRLLCPKCRREMDAHPYYGSGGAIIDNCPDCYWNWVDHGELARIVVAGPQPPQQPSVIPPPVHLTEEEEEENRWDGPF